MERLPVKFSDKFSEKRQRLDNGQDGGDAAATATPEDIWKALKAYLEDEVHIIRTYRPFNLTVPSDKTNDPKVQSKSDKSKKINNVRTGKKSNSAGGQCLPLGRSEVYSK